MIDSQLAKEIAVAQGAHRVWKDRVLTAIENGRQDFDIDIIRSVECCDLGEVLDSRLPASVGQSAIVAKVRHLHQGFHEAIADALTLSVEGRPANAALLVIERVEPVAIALDEALGELVSNAG